MTIEAALKQAVEQAGLPGAVAQFGNSQGTIGTAAVGVRDPASGAPMQDDTIFQIASMTKAIASVAALQLVERGKLALDAPASTFLPDLGDVKVVHGFSADGSAVFRAPTRPVTLRHLLTHTSGFGYDFMNETLVRANGPNAPAAGTRAWLRAPLMFDPGDRWEYGIGIDWAGLLVEAASGKTLEDYVQAEILAPLGMKDTSFLPSKLDASRRAALLSRQDDGSLTPFPIEIGGGDKAEFHAGGGGLYSTATDYLRFARMILAGGTLDGAKILKPETVAELSRNQIGALAAGRMETVVPSFALANEMFPDMHKGWSLAFLINPEAGPDGRAANSLAWAGIANTYYWIDPANDIAAVLMMQFLPFADPGAWSVLSAFERAVYGR